MAINRTAFNALVDDDGSGTTGTPWEKARIAGVILDPVDAALAALASVPPTNGWLPTLSTAAGGSPTGYVTQLAVFSRANGVVTISGRVTISGKGSLVAGSPVQVANLPLAAHSYCHHGGFCAGYWAGLLVGCTSILGYIDPGGNRLTLTYGPAAGAPGTVSTLMASMISDNFDVVFGGSYLVP